MESHELSDDEMAEARANVLAEILNDDSQHKLVNMPMLTWPTGHP